MTRLRSVDFCHIGAARQRVPVSSTAGVREIRLEMLLLAWCPVMSFLHVAAILSKVKGVLNSSAKLASNDVSQKCAKVKQVPRARLDMLRSLTFTVPTCAAVSCP